MNSKMLRKNRIILPKTKNIDTIWLRFYNCFMKTCIFKQKELEKLILDFYDSTGIAITLYDSEGRIIATSPIFCGFCAHIRRNRQCQIQCDCSNAVHIKEAEQKRTAVTYCCHAGNTELILPIFYENTVIAYLQIGQFHDARGAFSTPEKARQAARRYQMDEDVLMDLYRQVPSVSQQRLEALQNILKILVRSFWADGLIHWGRSMLSVKIENYITEHLAEKIYIQDICRQFSLSQNALYQLFREEFQTTVSDFITGKRLELAKELLLNRQELNVTQIATLCGFSDHNYFIRVFKKELGQTPLQYRKKTKVS